MYFRSQVNTSEVIFLIFPDGGGYPMVKNVRTSEVSSDIRVTARELAAMKLPGFPSTERACLDLVKRDEWRFVEVPGKGRGGIRREFMPPPDVAALIEARRRVDVPPAPTPDQSARPGAAPGAAPAPNAGTVRFEGGRVLIGDQLIAGLKAIEGGATRIDAPGPHFMELIDVVLLLRDSLPETATADLLDIAARAYATLSVLTHGRRDLIERMLNDDEILRPLLELMRRTDRYVAEVDGSSPISAWVF